MANVRIKSEKLTPFGGIFAIMEQFNALLSQTIDSTLGLRSKFYVLPIKRDTSLFYVRIFLRWLLCRRCDNSLDEAPVLASNSPNM